MTPQLQIKVNQAYSSQIKADQGAETRSAVRRRKRCRRFALPPHSMTRWLQIKVDQAYSRQEAGKLQTERLRERWQAGRLPHCFIKHQSTAKRQTLIPTLNCGMRGLIKNQGG